MKLAADPILLNPIPEISVDEILAGRERPFLTSLKGGRFMNSYDLGVLLQLLVLEEPDSIFEIGTKGGWVTLNMAANLPGAKIHTWNLLNSPANKTKLAFTESALSANIIKHQGRIKRMPPCFTTKPNEIPTFFFWNGKTVASELREDTQAIMDFAKLGPARAIVIWNGCNYRSPVVGATLAALRTSSGLNIRQISGTGLAIWSRRW